MPFPTFPLIRWKEKNGKTCHSSMVNTGYQLWTGMGGITSYY